MGVITWWSLLLGLIPAIIAVNPGLKLRITQNGLNYAATKAIKSLSLLQGKTIPDIRASDIKLKVGKLKDYSFTNFRIGSFETPNSHLSIQAGKGIHWSIQGASIRLTGNWHYHYKLGFIPGVVNKTEKALGQSDLGPQSALKFPTLTLPSVLKHSKL